MKIVTLLAVTCVSLWATPGRADDGAENALRALFTIVNERIGPEGQHCNFGAVYLQSHHNDSKDATVGEALLGELAEMADGGHNAISGACHGRNPKRCSVHLYHECGEAASSTQFDFEVVGGKAQIATLVCLSTP
ncbi:MAG TPA: hypothetical protein VI113_11285 [Alphaproteobacteria bacterium]